MVRRLEEMRLAAGLSGRQDLPGRPFRPGRHVPVDQLPTITRVRQDGFGSGTTGRTDLDLAAASFWRWTSSGVRARMIGNRSIQSASGRRSRAAPCVVPWDRAANPGHKPTPGGPRRQRRVRARRNRSSRATIKHQRWRLHVTHLSSGVSFPVWPAGSPLPEWQDECAKRVPRAPAREVPKAHAGQELGTDIAGTDPDSEKGGRTDRDPTVSVSVRTKRPTVFVRTPAEPVRCLTSAFARSTGGAPARPCSGPVRSTGAVGCSCLAAQALV